MDLALESTNQRGLYQIYLIIIVIFLPFSTYIIAAGFPYLTNVPVIYCQLKEKQDSPFEECNMKEFCKDENKYNIKFDYKKSVDNYSLKYKLYCSRSKLCPFLNSSFFFGAVIGVMICAHYPDRIGRLPVLKFLMIINIFAQINYLFGINFYHILFISFFSGFATYCNSVLSLMKNVMEYGSREKGITIADITDIAVKQPQKPMRILTREEQATVSDYLKDNLTECNLGIFLCLYTGLRIGEVCALKWEDIHIPEKYLYVHQTMQRIQVKGNPKKKTEVVIQPPKSDCSIRSIPIPEEIIQLLLPAKKENNAFLLTGQPRVFIEPRCLENQFKSVIKECHIKDVNFHALRHTFATRCVELGFDIKSLSEILGHASVNITLNRYVHPSMDLKQQNMNKLCELLTTK